LRRTIRSFREHVAVEVPVVARVGVDEATDRTVLVRERRLDAAPAVAVPRDDDFPFDADAERREPVVILRDAVVGVHEWSGHVSIGRIRHIGGKLAGLAGGRIVRDRRLLEHGLVVSRRYELHLALERRRKQDVELLDVRVESE
jgi:hypothetical protein